jgi:DNA-binding response OmpR family regulator
MKQILIIDESPLFREYLRLKLVENEIEVSVGINAMDGISKMRNVAPDLIILDYNLSKHGLMEVLKQKKTNPNTINIPVIILARHIDQKRLIELVPYNVKKIFTKPAKIDALFTTLSELLKVPFSIDESPGIVEVHVNDEIIFIEIAQGLNRDKLDLLRFKIIELIELYQIRIPKVIVMLSDIKLGFADGPNMQKLLETLVQSSQAKPRNIRVLTRDDFARRFVESQKRYPGIEVVTNLQYAVDDLLMEIAGNGTGKQKAEIIGDKVLAADTAAGEEAMALKFHTEGKGPGFESLKESLQNLRIAAIDDDIIILELLKNTFTTSGAVVKTYSDGSEFLADLDTETFDLAFLDLIMPKADGFEVLRALQARDIRYPVIVLSAITQRETVIKAFQMGIKSYLVKPLKPADIFKKSLEILRANF